MYGFTFKESILANYMEDYVGLTSIEVGYVQMLESLMFIGFSIVIGIVP
jgi:hypothetical protein